MIRQATIDDIDDLIVLGRELHQESRFSVLSFSEEKVRNTMMHLLNDPNGFLMVSVKDGVVIGGFAGFITEHFFSTDLMATDVSLFIHKSDRGGMSAALLIRAFIRWAKKKNASSIQLGISTMINVEETSKLYNALGFKTIGSIFAYEGDL